MPRRYVTVEPKLARLLEPGDRYPVERVVATVIKAVDGVLVMFDDGAELRLGYDDALLVAVAPEEGSRARESADAAAVAADDGVE